VPKVIDGLGRLLLSVIVCAAGSCACDTKTEQQSDRSVEAREQFLHDLEEVAYIATSAGATHRLVEAELSAAGIESWMEGSIIYTVSVRKADAEAAREVLRKSERVHASPVRLIDASGGTAP